MDLETLLTLAVSPAEKGAAGLGESNLPFAEVNVDGVVCGINSLGKMAWDWKEGNPVSQDLELALKASDRDETSELPVQMGGLIVGVIPQSNENGWYLIGYAPQESKIRA